MTPFYPLYKKELAHYFYTPSAYIVSAAFLAITGYLFAVPLFVNGMVTMAPLADNAPLLLTFFIPAITMRLFAEEFKTGTYELIAAMPATEFCIAAAKYSAALTLVSVILGLTAVYPATLFILGRPDAGAVAGTYMGLWLAAAMLIAAGMLASALTKNQVVAFILGFLAAFAFYLAGKVTPFLPLALMPAADFAGLDSHLHNMALGVFDTRDILYYFSITAFFLLLTVQALKNRKGGTQ